MPRRCTGEAAGTVAAGEFREAALLAASSNSVALQDLVTFQDVLVAGSWSTRAHGFLAVEWLANHAGDAALFDYYRLLPDATSRHEAFEQAFGLTLEAFYEQFEAYRATLEGAMTTSSPLALAHLRRALLVTLALLALGIGVAPGHAVAASDAAGTSEADTITTVLYPGWNLVGWVGADAPTSELFDAIPALRQVSAWDAEAQAYRHALRRRYDDVPALTPGVGLWLRLDGSSAVEWIRPVSGEGMLLSLRAGRNLVGWTGRDGAPVAQAMTSLGDAMVRARGWDAPAQRYVRYIAAAGPVGDIAGLNHGDGLWIEASQAVGWWQPGSGKPPITFLGDVAEQAQADILAEFEEVQAFFVVRFAALGRGRHQYIGATLDDIRTIYRAVFGGEPRSTAFCGRTDAVSVDVYLLGCAQRLQAPSYIEALMLEIPGKGPSTGGRQGLDPRGPSWLILGTNQYSRLSYQGVTDPYFSYATERDYHRGWASRTELPLRDFHVFEGHSGPISSAGRSLGFLAAERLAERAGAPALFEYLRLMRDTNDWQQVLRDSVRHQFGRFLRSVRGLPRQRIRTACPSHGRQGRGGARRARRGSIRGSLRDPSRVRGCT